MGYLKIEHLCQNDYSLFILRFIWEDACQIVPTTMDIPSNRALTTPNKHSVDGIN